MTNTPTSGRPSDRAIAQAWRECCAGTYAPDRDVVLKRARELDAAHPVATTAPCATCEGVGLANVVDYDGALVVDDCPECGGESHPVAGEVVDEPVLYVPTIAAQASVSEEEVEQFRNDFNECDSTLGRWLELSEVADIKRALTAFLAKRIAAGGDQ